MWKTADLRGGRDQIFGWFGRNGESRTEACSETLPGQGGRGEEAHSAKADATRCILRPVALAMGLRTTSACRSILAQCADSVSASVCGWPRSSLGCRWGGVERGGDDGAREKKGRTKPRRDGLKRRATMVVASLRRAEAVIRYRLKFSRIFAF